MTTNERRREQMETIRVGYQVAADLFMYESQQVWSRFNIMVVANSILYGGIILLLADKVLDNLEPSHFAALAMPVVGLFLCAVWWLLTKRGTASFRYFQLSARELEQHLLPHVRTIERGREFADGRQVTFTLPSGSMTHQMPCSGRVSISRLSYAVIVLFGLGYVPLIVLLWLQLQAKA